MKEQAVRRLLENGLTPSEEQSVEEHPDEIVSVVKTYIRCKIETVTQPDIICHVETPPVEKQNVEALSGSGNNGMQAGRRT